MLLDETIVAMEVDTTALVGDAPATVDDVVIRYADKRSVYLQCKKNEPDFDAWSINALSDELYKVAAVLRKDPSGRVMFYSRNNFGQIGKLREHAQTQPEHGAYIKSLGKALKKEHVALIKYFGGKTGSSVETFSLLQRVEFETTSTIERLTEKNKAMLVRHLENPHAAYSAIWTAVDQLAARIVRADGGIHSLTRAQLFLLLSQHGCAFLSSPWTGMPEAGRDVDGLTIPASIRRTLTATGEDSIESWEKRYKALVARLQSQEPSSMLAEAGQRLENGDYEGAQECIDAAIDSGKRNTALLATAYASKAEIQLLHFEHGAALKSLSEASHWDPENTDITTNYINLLIRLEQYRDAIRILHVKIQGPVDELTRAHWHCNLGVALFALDDFAGADKEFANAEKIFSSPGAVSSGSRSDLVHGLYVSRGMLFEQQGNVDKAEQYYKAAAFYFRQELNSSSGSIQARLGLAQTLNNLGLLYWELGSVDDISALFEEARNTLSGIEDWNAKHDLALITLNHGEFLTTNGRFREAEPLILESLQIRRSAMKENRWHPAAAAALCENLLGLGTLYLRSGRPVDALRALEEARAQVELLRHEDPVIYSMVLARYATNATAIYRANCKFEDALDAADEAVRVLRKQVTSDSILEDIATALNNKGNVLMEMKKIREAGNTHHEALKIRAKLAASGNHRHQSEYAISLFTWASLLVDAEAAKACFAEAERIWESLVEEHPALYRYQYALFLDMQCLKYIDTANQDKAVESGRAAVHQFRALNRERHAYLREVAGALCNLALAHESLKEFSATVHCLEESRDIFKELQRDGDVRTIKNLATVQESLYQSYSSLNKEILAQKARQAALETLQQLANGPDETLNAYVAAANERLNNTASVAARQNRRSEKSDS
jgi:tetratricopeptide (TPR) repeat protein